MNSIENHKNDIEYIFLRFFRVLQKGHGAFRTFMARLSDVFFVPSRENIEFIKACLRKNNFTEDEIKSK